MLSSLPVHCSGVHSITLASRGHAGHMCGGGRMLSLNLVCCLHCRSIVVGSTLSLWPVVATQATCGGGGRMLSLNLVCCLHCRSIVVGSTLSLWPVVATQATCEEDVVSQSYLLSSLPVHCSRIHSITLASRGHECHMWRGDVMYLNLVCCLHCRSIVVGSTLSLWPVVATQATCVCVFGGGVMSLNLICCLHCRSIVVGSTLSLWPVVATQATCGGGGRMSLNLVCCLHCRSIVVGSTLSLWPVVATQATCVCVCLGGGVMSLNLICCLHCRSIVVGSTLSLWPVVATQATCGGGGEGCLSILFVVFSAGPL